MTRTHAALQLLAHGPLRFKEFQAITGWPAKRCKWVLQYLVERRFDLQRNNGFFELADGTNYPKLPDVPELATQSQPSHGPAPAGPLRPRASMDVLPAAAPVQKAQAGCAGCGRGAGQVECAGVKA